MKSKALVFILVFLVCCNTVAKTCVGKFVNPITDVCWSCMFPISVGSIPVNFNGQLDTKNPAIPVCMCNSGPGNTPEAGIPISFWEPVYLVDVTRTPYCMVGLGGFSMSGSGMKGRGSVEVKNGHKKKSFYNAHMYVYPLISWLGLLPGFSCLDMSVFEIGFLTELDPSWNNDEISVIFNPEAALFSNPIMHAACAADCVATTAGFPINSLSWCAGCHGNTYPFTGTIANHIGGVESSLLITQKLLAELHRIGFLYETSGEGALCGKKLKFIIKKDQYKTQMTYPKAHTSSKKACNPLGKTSIIWGSTREYPYKGEDFGFLIWRKRNCCLPVVSWKTVVSATTGVGF